MIGTFYDKTNVRKLSAEPFDIFIALREGLNGFASLLQNKIQMTIGIDNTHSIPTQT